jgi:LysM repeat protein
MCKIFISMRINEELCASIPDFSRYVISEKGRIYRIKALNKKEALALENNPEKPYVRESKYQVYVNKSRGRWSQVGLINDNGRFMTAAVEKLLCTAFELWPDKKKNMAITFKDNNPNNIQTNNIEFEPWKPRNSKLSTNDVKEIKKKINSGMALNKISKEYGVSDMQISRIKSGENWRKGGRKIPVAKAPFNIEDGKIRRFLSTFEFTAIDNNIRRPFTIKRSKTPSDNKIIGVVNGYRVSKKHKNISRARELVYKLNLYFFNEDIAIKAQEKLVSKEPDKNLTTI